MRIIDADNMAVVESEAFLYAQSRIKDEMTRSVNAVVHTKIQQLIADTPDADAADVLRNQWISVKDRMPEKYVDASGDLIDFLVYMPKYGVDIANYSIQDKTWFCLGIPSKVTHWMPLPEPPEPPELPELPEE